MVLQDGLANSAETVKSAVEGQAGVLVKGSRLVSPGGRSSNNNVDGDGLGAAESPPVHQLRFRGLEPSKRYAISLCTESNSGTLSRVTVAEAEAHAEAPLVRPVYYKFCSQATVKLVVGACKEACGRGRKYRDTSRFSVR